MKAYFFRVLSLFTAALLLLVGPAKGEIVGPYPTSLNVKNFGAVGDGKADDTRAIQAAADAALAIEAKGRMAVGTARGLNRGTKSSTYPEIYFPEGTYRISDTVLFQQSAYLRGSGKSVVVQTNSEKDSFYFHYSFRYAVDNLAFDGGKTQLRFWTGNIWSRIAVTQCRFTNATEFAVECNSFTKEKLTGNDWNRSKPYPPYTVEGTAGEWKLTRNPEEGLIRWYNSTLLSIDGCHFENCMKALSVSCDSAVVNNSTVITHRDMEGAALILGGQVRVSNLKGMARLNPGKHQYWAEGEGNIAFRDINLDTDSDAGVALIHSSVKPTPTSRGVRIENAILKSGGSRENAIIWIKEGTMPNIVSITNVRETSKVPVKAIVWEGKPRLETLEKIKFFNTVPLEEQFKIVVGNNSSGIDETLPDLMSHLAESAIPNEALRETLVKPVVWNDEPKSGGSGMWTVIDARAHGVDPASDADQTAAIQGLFDFASKQPETEVVFPGGASYRVSDTIRLPAVVRATVAGVSRFIQTDLKKPLFQVDEARKLVFRNADFIGGSNAFAIRSAADAECAILFDSCSFYDQQGPAIRCFSGTSEGTQPNRTRILVKNAIFKTEQGVVTNAAQSQMESLWAFNDPHLNERAFFENHGGEMRIQSMLGNPSLWYGERAKVPKEISDWPYSRNTRWVDNWGKLYCEEIRFGGESGGMCNVFNRSPEGTVYIGGGLTRFNNGATKQAILFAEAVPRVTVLSAVSSSAGAKYIRVMDAKGDRLKETAHKIYAAGVLTP